MSPVFVCVFPGQGSHQVGMGRDLIEAFPTARQVFEEVDDRLGMALSRLCLEGPEDQLRLTEQAQPAILAVSVAAYRVLRETTGACPVAIAGHSLGEWSALVAAESVSLADAVVGVRERGRLMQRAVPESEGAMAAIIGLEPEAVAALCAEAADGDVLELANLNGAGQVVVAGHARAVARLLPLVTARKARAQRLAVSAPFHCALMAPAAVGLARYLDLVRFLEPTVPVVTSVEARPIVGADEIRHLLVRQVTAPVRWQETMHGLADFGPALAFEVGPGRVLSGLWRRTLPQVTAVPVGDFAGVVRAQEMLA